MNIRELIYDLTLLYFKFQILLIKRNQIMKKPIIFLFFIMLLSNSVCIAQPKVIAHRGFWDTENSAQNSITSLYKAAEIGCYGSEFDVRTTSDGVLVVYHDDVIEGMDILNTPYEKIRNCKLKNGEVIPTLEQYLVHAKNCPNIKLILEIKTGKRTKEGAKFLVDSTLMLVDKYQLQDRTEYIAFSMDICQELLRQRPGYQVAYLNGDVPPAKLKEMGFPGLDYYYSGFTNNLNLVNDAHANGLWVNVWTVNDPVLMKRFIGMEADFITTDKPLLLQQIIKEYKEKYTAIDKPQVDLSKFKKDKDSYITLFDGISLDGWRGYNRDQVTDKWIIEDGTLKFDSKKQGPGGEIIFAHKFKNFELDLEWKISEGGNSGIFYLIQEIPNQYAAASAPEAQVLDNDNHPDAKLGKDGNRKSTSLYDLIPANPQNAKPFGKWNRVKIRVDNGNVSHYQNGKKVLGYTLFTPEWVKMLENSKFSIGSWDDAFYLMSNCGGVKREGYIGFQDHGNDVWFRNIKIKILD